MQSSKAITIAAAALFLVFGPRSSLSYRFGGFLHNILTKHIDDLNVQYWIDTLELTPHVEGGYFAEVYRSNETIGNLPHRYGEQRRSFGTSIYYLLESHDFSAFHVLKSDELWHFYYGRPLSIYLIDPNTGELEVANLGPRQDEHFLFLVPRGMIFAARLKSPDRGGYTLIGATVIPGFEFDDFQFVSRAELISRFPQHQDLITELTRN